jgi:hypothetical protein
MISGSTSINGNGVGVGGRIIKKGDIGQLLGVTNEESENSKYMERTNSDIVQFNMKKDMPKNNSHNPTGAYHHNHSGSNGKVLGGQTDKM